MTGRQQGLLVSGARRSRPWALALVLFVVVRGGALLPAADIIVADTDGALGLTGAPVMALVDLTAAQQEAAKRGRLGLHEVPEGKADRPMPVAAQWLRSGEAGGKTWLCWRMPKGAPGQRAFRLEEGALSGYPVLTASDSKETGQYEMREGAAPILRYNYRTVEPGDLEVAAANRIYARARSDYIHPLYGLAGQSLTHDWSRDHPHHRGIYWAWPEVDWRGERGDLHALQRVFARPTGNCSTLDGQVFTQLDAENVWRWNDREGIVHERVIIRAYGSTPLGRLIDLEFEFEALTDPVRLARRDTDKYGGLNIRMASVEDQCIVFVTDPEEAAPRMAWAALTGVFPGSKLPTGLAVLPRSSNPDYPGDWVQYPDLNWFQPTFPAAGTRYELRRGQPLVLRFRLWVLANPGLSPEAYAQQWRAYHSAAAPRLLD